MRRAIIAISALVMFIGCGEPDPIEKDTTDATMVIDEMYADSSIVRWTGIHITRDSSDTAEYFFRIAKKPIDEVGASDVGESSFFEFAGHNYNSLLIEDINNKNDLESPVMFDVTKIDTIQCDYLPDPELKLSHTHGALVYCMIYSIDNEIISQFETGAYVNNRGYMEYTFIPVLEVHRDNMIKDRFALDVFDPTKGFDGLSFKDE